MANKYTSTGNIYTYDGLKQTAAINFGFATANKFPAITKRIFTTKEEAQAYIDNVNDTAIAGLILSVTGDTDTTNNGIYFVESIGTDENHPGVLSRAGGGLEIDDKATVTTGCLKTYEFKENGVSLGKIDIPKDFLVKSATVKVNPKEATEEGFVTDIPSGHTYFEFIINTKDNDGSETDSPIRVDLNELVEYFEAGTTAEIQLAFVTNDEGKREVQATVVKIGAEKITTSAIEASESSVALTGTTLADQLSAIGIAIKEVEQKSTKISESNKTNEILEFISDNTDDKMNGLAIKENASWDCGEW